MSGERLDSEVARTASNGKPVFQHFAGVAQLVEHNVANVVVVGSNPIARSLCRACRKFLVGAYMADSEKRAASYLDISCCEMFC